MLFSGYLDSLWNNTMMNTFQSAMPMNVPFLADYPGAGNDVHMTILVISRNAPDIRISGIPTVPNIWSDLDILV